MDLLSLQLNEKYQQALKNPDSQHTKNLHIRNQLISNPPSQRKSHNTDLLRVYQLLGLDNQLNPQLHSLVLQESLIDKELVGTTQILISRRLNGTPASRLIKCGLTWRENLHRGCKATLISKASALIRTSKMASQASRSRFLMKGTGKIESKFN